MTAQKEDRKGFVFFASWHRVLKRFPAELRGRVYDAIVEYAVEGTIPEDLDGPELMAFEFIKEDVDLSTGKYEQTCEKRRQAVRKRWEKSNAVNAEDSEDKEDNTNDTNVTNVSDVIQTKQKNTKRYNKDKKEKEKEDKKEKEKENKDSPYGEGGRSPARPPAPTGGSRDSPQEDSEGATGDSCESDRPYMAFRQWMDDHTPHVTDRYGYLTPDDFHELRDRYGPLLLKNLENLENRPDLIPKYRDLSATMRKWCGADLDKKT